MTWLSDAAVAHLKAAAAGSPNLTGTKYALVGPLASGGMGTVYVARDLELGREVALKVVDADDPTAAERMRREAQILARLEHPGLVPVHDVGTLADGRCFYAMKLVRGRRLDEHARDGRSLPELLAVFEKVCEAVAFAHAQGVLHRDLKPANVMVGPFGEALVMDWGVAQLRSGPGESPGTVLGTPGYMSPEQARGELDKVDERSDVHALGAILRFLVEPAVPAALAAVCRKAMAEDPAARYGSVRELSEEIVRFLQALISAPETRPLIVGIVIGSTIKGLVTGVLVGWIARRVGSLAVGILAGLAVGVALAFLVALGNGYYWQMMLPGAVLGIIVGYATYRHAEPVARSA